MHNLYPNPSLSMPFRHILDYLQALGVPNIPNCDTTYRLSYLSFYQTLFLGFMGMVFCIRPCLRDRASRSSSCSINIGWPCTTTHNIVPHVYTTREYRDTNSFKIIFHISSQNHNSNNASHSPLDAKWHISFAFTPFYPLIN